MNVKKEYINNGFTILIKLVLATTLLLNSSFAHSQSYIRYNQLGYAPFSEKILVVMSDQDLKGQKWSLTSEGKELESKVFDEKYCGVGIHSPFKYNYQIDLSKYSKLVVYEFKTTDTSIQFKVDTNLYSFLPQEILRYFRVQRSGTKECLDHKISHKGDKSCIIHRRTNGKNDAWAYVDYMPKKVDMLGGWYDAGDYIKFTLTASYSAYMLLLAYEQNPTIFQSKVYSQTQFNDLLDEASWGLDYLLKTYQDSTEFILQVGGHRDHQQGNRMPEFDELNRQREAYSGFSPTQMGMTAAALALGAKTFEKVDTIRSKQYKEMSISIYKKARTLNECYWIKQGWEEFYADKTPYDNLLLAATELYLLTQNVDYKEDARFFSTKANQAYWASWGNVNALAHTRSRQMGINKENFDLKDLAYFDAYSKEKDNVWNLAHKYTWGSLYSFYAEANASLMYQLSTKDTTFKSHSSNTLDYSLGKNNWGKSFVCSNKIADCACNTYSQIYILQPNLKPIGAVSEGPGDRATHEQIKKYFKIPDNYPLEKFNSNSAVFYDLNTNFQTMETTIVGLSDALLFYALMDLTGKKVD